MIEYTVGIFYLRWDLRPLRPSPALIILALWGSGITAPHPALRDIGAVGFEPTTASSQSWYSTKLSYAPD